MAQDYEQYKKLVYGDSYKENNTEDNAAGEESTANSSFLNQPLLATVGNSINDFVNPSEETRQNLYDTTIEDAQHIDINPEEFEENPGIDEQLAEKNEQAREDFVGLVNEKAADSNSVLQDKAQSLRASSLYRNYVMTTPEKLEQAKKIEERTGISADVIMEDDTAFKNAQHVSDYMEKMQAAVGPNKIFSVDNIYKMYPELKGLPDMDEVELAEALHNIDNIKRTGDAIQDIKNVMSAFWENGKKKLEHDKLYYKIYQGKASEDEIARAEQLHQELNTPGETPRMPDFLDHPLEYAFGGVAGSMPEMLEGFKGNIIGGTAGFLTAASALITSAAVTGKGSVLTDTMKTGTGAEVPALTAAMLFGWKIGSNVVGTAALAEPETGSAFAEMRDRKDKDGNRLYEDSDLKIAAPAAGVLNAAIENWSNKYFLGKILPQKSLEKEAFTHTVSAITENVIASKTAAATAKQFFKARGKDFLEASVAESGEESFQGLSADLVDNALVAQTGKGEYHTVTEMVRNFINNFADALPTSMTFGTVAAGGGTLTGSIGLSKNMLHIYDFNQKFDEDAQHTILGINLLGRLQDAVKNSKLKDTNPELQQKIIRNQLAGSGFEMAYIDTKSLLEQENGMEQLQKIATAAGYDEAAVQEAVKQGNMNVTLESFAQSESDASVYDSISFDKEEPSLREVKEHAREMMDKQIENAANAKAEIEKLKGILVRQYFPDDSDAAEEALIAMYDNPQNPAQGLRQIEKNLQDAKDNLIKPAMDALKSGMGNGVDIIQNEEGGIRVSNNDQWYRDFYKENGRAPHIDELEDMAVALMTGESGAPQLQGWQLNEQEYRSASEMRQQLADINKELEIVQRAKEKMGDLTSAEVKNLAGLTEEGFKVYRTVRDKLAAAPGTASRAARVSAIILARHADLYAKAMQKAGRKYTAEDYFNDKLRIQFEGEPQAGGFNQQEMQQQKTAIRQQYTNEDGTMKEGWLKAPNGKATNLTEEQWCVVRTENFKRWFGDWENDAENASKVVDENGEPRVMYHGTPLGGFTEFKRELNHFTPHEWYAEFYHNPGASSDYVKGVHEELGIPMTYAVFLNIKKPFDTRNAAEREIFEKEFYRQWGNGTPLSEKGLPDWTDSYDLKEFFEEKGYDYDGLFLDEGGIPDERTGEVISRGISYVAFKSNQIKSATSNNGNFSQIDDNIYHQSASLLAHNRRYVLTSDNSINYGVINHSVADDGTEIKEAPVRLSVGFHVGGINSNNGAGLAHIQKHRKYLADRFSGTEAAIKDILLSAEFLEKDKARDGYERLILFKDMKDGSAVRMVLDLMKDYSLGDEYYSVQSITPLTGKQYTNKKAKALSFNGWHEPLSSLSSEATTAAAENNTESAAALVPSKESAFGTVSMADAENLVKQYIVANDAGEILDTDQFFQSVTNPAINLHTKVQTVKVKRQFAGKKWYELRDNFPESVKNGILTEIAKSNIHKPIINKLNKARILISDSYISHILSDHTSNENKTNTRRDVDRYEIIAALPQILEEGVMVEEHADRHNKSYRIYRLFCPVQLDDDKPILVKLTLKNEKTAYKIDDSEDIQLTSIKEYDEEITKKELKQRPPMSSDEVSHEGSPLNSLQYSIEDLLAGVNDNHGNPYIIDGELNEDYSLNTNTFSSESVIGAGKRNDFEYLNLVEQYQTGTEAEKAAAWEKLTAMVQKAAAAAGFDNAIPEQTAAYKVRTGKAPQKTVKVYKVFTMSPDGSPTALFIGGTEKLPQNVWLDAVSGWHFKAKNGQYYVPSTQNPYTKGGKTGASVDIPNEEVRQELIKRGFLPEGSKAKKITALAYRPGWHAGTMPFFPQGGMKPPEGMNSAYENIHRYNQVVFECELAADKDYTAEAEAQPKARKKNGELNTKKADLQYMPENGFYYYATNPMTHGHPELGMWAISGALKINRALSQEECDKILKDNNLAAQEWEGGKLDLEGLGYTGQQQDAARKTLAPITYDDNGKVIPLSQRFNPAVNDVRYQNEGNHPKGATGTMPDGTRLIQLFATADESTFLHEMGHLFLLDLEDLAQVDEQSAKELQAVREWAEWHKGDWKKYRGTAWSKEFSEREQAIIDAEQQGDYDEADRQKRVWQHERFARAFELYLRDGKAPAKGLRAVFRSFAKFLRQVYSAFIADGARASAEVEHIMGRMMATDEEIEAMSLDDEFRDIEKAGGEKLLNETERETYERWLNEAKEEAREKLHKIVMKDMLERDKELFDEHLKQVEQQKRQELEQQPIYLARAIIEKLGGDRQGALNVYPNMEEFEKADKTAPPIEQAVQDYLDEWRRDYEAEDISVKLNEDAVREAMESTAYHHKAKALEAAALARKLDLKNKINSKAEQAMQGIKDALDALPEQYDLQNDKNEKPVKQVMAKINALRFSAKWTAKDFAEIEKMIKAASREELEKQLQAFKENIKQQKLDVNAVERANEGRMKLYRELAAKAVQDQPIYNATNVNEHRRNQRKAETMVRRMVKAGNIQAAIQQQQAAAMAAATAREAEKAKERVDKMVNEINRQLNAKSVKLPAKERYWHRHLAYILRIGVLTDVEKPVLKKGQKLGDLKDLLKNYQDRLDLTEDFDVEAINDIITNIEKTGYKSLTMDDFQKVYDLMQIVYKCGKDEFSLKTIAGKTIEEAVQDIIKETALADKMNINQRHFENNTGGLGWNDWAGKVPGVGEGIAKRGQSYLSISMKPEEIIKLLGEKAHRYIYGTFDKAVNDEAEMMAKAVQEVQQLLAEYSHQERQSWKDFKYEIELPTKEGGTAKSRCSKENIICMALNMGTAINRQRLVGGLFGPEAGATEAQQQAGMNAHLNYLQQFMEQNLTKQDWETVQKLWDYISSYWPETARVEEELNGMHLEKQQAMPFDVRTADGQIVHMNGGYYPIKYNKDKNANAAELAKDDVAKQQGGGAKVFGTGRGFVKARSEGDVYQELQLTFDIIPTHLQQVIHNITTRLAARDVYRLLNNATMSDYITSHLGAPYQEILVQWAKDCWTQLPEKDLAAKVGESIFAKFRRNSTFAIMAYRVWPALENFSNIGPVADKLGWMNALGAVTEFYSHMSDFRKLLDKSVLMRNRLNNMDRDIRSQGGMFNVDNKVMETIREHGYDFMTYSDLMFSAPLWCRAYKQAYMEQYQLTYAENEANKKKQQAAQDKLDKLRGQLLDAKKDIKDWHEEKRNRAKAGQIGWQQGTSRFAVMPRSEFNVALPELENRLGELGRAIWQAEADHGHASEIKIYQGQELIDEVERRAAFKADAAVRDAFGSGRTVDLAAVSRSTSELVKAMTTFYSFFNTQFNAIYFKYLHGKYGEHADVGGWQHLKDYAPFAKAVMNRIIITSLIGSLLKMATKTDGDSDRDKWRKVKGADGKEHKEEVPWLERFLKVFGKNALSMAFGAFYGVRDIGNLALNQIFDGTDYGRGLNITSTPLRSAEEVYRTIKLIASKSERDLQIQEKEEREQEKLKHMTRRQRAKYEEEKQYKKPQHRITYAEIFRHGANAATGFTAATTGISSTIVDAVTGTMQYMLDTDNRYDANWRNLIWSAVFDKKPVEREIPQKPEQPEKKKRKKK